jgi:hypothetical protein
MAAFRRRMRDLTRLAGVPSRLLCLIVPLCSLVNVARCAADDGIWKAVNELVQMRGEDSKTRYKHGERRAGELLKQFSDPNDQGQIWFELTQLYGQTAGPPQRIVECAKQALQFPVEPQQKIRLYEYWADGLCRTDRYFSRRSELRRAAAAVCLDGLVEFNKIDVANYVPRLPPGALPKIPPSLDPSERAFWEKERSDAKAKAHAIFVRDITLYRDALNGRIMFMYTLRPYAAADELRALIMEKTNDSQWAGRLAGVVEEKVKADIAKYGPDVPPPPPERLNPPPAKGRQVFMLSGLLLLLVVLIAVFVVRQWFRFHRVRDV